MRCQPNASIDSRYCRIHAINSFSLRSRISCSIRSGRAKVLGVAGPRRLAMLPNVATLAEQGITGADNLLWIGLATTARVPRPIIDKLNAEVNRTIQMPDVKQRFDQLGMDVEGGTPARFEQFIREQADALRRLIKAGVLPME